MQGNDPKNSIGLACGFTYEYDFIFERVFSLKVTSQTNILNGKFIFLYQPSYNCLLKRRLIFNECP